MRVWEHSSKADLRNTLNKRDSTKIKFGCHIRRIIYKIYCFTNVPYWIFQGMLVCSMLREIVQERHVQSVVFLSVLLRETFFFNLTLGIAETLD